MVVPVPKLSDLVIAEGRPMCAADHVQHGAQVSQPVGAPGLCLGHQPLHLVGECQLACLSLLAATVNCQQSGLSELVQALSIFSKNLSQDSRTMGCLQLMKRHSKWALSMRLRHLAVTTAESRTILVQVSFTDPLTAGQ